jgi:hypothetical protein
MPEPLVYPISIASRNLDSYHTDSSYVGRYPLMRCSERCLRDTERVPRFAGWRLA